MAFPFSATIPPAPVSPSVVAAPVATNNEEEVVAVATAAIAAARGESEITNIHYVERGYENIIDKLRGVGADITLVRD